MASFQFSDFLMAPISIFLKEKDGEAWKNLHTFPPPPPPPPRQKEKENPEN